MADNRIPSPLQAELAQQVPFRDARHEAVVGLARTASVLERTVACRLRPWKLSFAQYNVLRILQGAGPDGLPTLSIRTRLIDPAAAVTRLVDKLERAGFVERARVGSDRRQVRCRITAQGSALLVELEPVVAAVHADVGATLSDEQLRMLTGLLDEVRAALMQGEKGR